MWSPRASTVANRSLVVEPFLAADRAAQRRPVALGFHADQPEHPVVRGRVVGGGRLSQAFPRADQQLRSPQQRGVHVEPDRVRGLAEQRRGDDLALAGPLAMEQRGRDRAGGGKTGVVVAHTAALERRLTTGWCEHVGEAAARPERGDVEAGLVDVVALESVGGHRAVDQTGVAGGHRLGVEAHPLECARPHVRHEHVGLVDQAQRELTALVGTDVEHDRALAAVVELERRVRWQLGPEHLPELPARVTGGRFDLDHVGAPVGEDHRRGRAGDPDPHLDDANTFHRPRHGASVGAVRRWARCGPARACPRRRANRASRRR